MDINDPLLEFMSKDAARTEPRMEHRRIRVLVGGFQFEGVVVSPQPFLTEALQTQALEEYEDRRSESGAGGEADKFLHLLVDDGPGITPMDKHYVRFRINNIAAWWTNNA
ncbi:hypothetical protein ACWGJ0_26565 [Streptomyces massasporeus]